MKRLYSFLLVMTVALPLAAQDPSFSDYIAKYSSLAVSEMQRTGVPASITLAQGLVESAAGKSPLAVHANNHFGIKCHSDWKGMKFYKDDDEVQECFRVYESAEESFRAHSDYLRERDWYSSLFDLDPTDYKGWAKGLRKAGYATDPRYADKLIKLIEDYDLGRFDIPAEKKPDVPVVAEVPPTPARKVLVPTDTLYKERVSVSLSRPVYERNGVPIEYAVEGDSYASIAERHGLFLREILSFNDLKQEEPLEPGSVVYLARKKKEGAYGSYEVRRDGETLWEISQFFGIQLRKLREYNAYRGDAPFEEGDTVLLSKAYIRR